MADTPFGPQRRYQIESRLGEGGVGEVFRAFDTRLQRHVALKRLSPRPIGTEATIHDDAWREAVHLAALEHPNIVTVYDFDADEAGPFLVMELVAGETLEAVVARGALPLEDFHILATQALEGLAAAHHIGLYHCDLKPSNLMLKYNGLGHLQVKLLDFGIAGFSMDVNAPPASSTPEERRMVLGTAEFMAPERFEQQPVSARSEIYSLGCLFYFALTGVDPFGGHTLQDVIVSHLQSLVVPLEELRADLPIPLCRWVMRLVSRQPTDRPASVLDALAELYDLPSPDESPTAVTGLPVRP